VEFRKSVKAGLESGFDSENVDPLQVSLDQENQKYVLRIYTQIDGLFQSKLRIPAACDLLRIHAF
jgi:hypothetical protein